ncbi:MAG: hypothetical protein KVP17_001552 [Porospora cf. gigantea B]|uniref:uncharacterized protein n=1 Tax=Porospora cf. gigantea B TaxID=2853592 RepID=UPI003571DA8B|nr:MAG: hypothetical protein KVP17_001552 [Porospora cf. gigantea B]
MASLNRKGSFQGDTPQSLTSYYRRHGQINVNELTSDQIQAFFNHAGFTGETYADFDTVLGPQDPITILHFNDVYNIEQGPDGMGGISRFVTAVRRFANCNPLILFSGDLFNPSMLSTLTRGRHMVPFFNLLKVHTACVGNHDLDFGVDQMEYLIGSCQCPWVLSNVMDAYNPDMPLGSSRSYRIFEWQGHRVGIIGLVEKEWLSTLATLGPKDLVYSDFVETGKALCAFLKSKEVTLIIALTHMRSPNDERLARGCPDIDIILGGHDHEYFGFKRLHNSLVGKSGTDFREFSVLTVHPASKAAVDPLPYDSIHFPDGTLDPDDPSNRDGGVLEMPMFLDGSVAEWACVTVDSNTPGNAHVDKLVDKYVAGMKASMGKVIGCLGVTLETRFKYIRTQETNAGNWLCDLMRQTTRADVAILNSGTVRSDCEIPAGPFTLRDLTMMLPLQDDLLVVELAGSHLLEVLEAGVSMYPRLEGRFLQVGGLTFEFDPRQPSGSRVLPNKVQVKRYGSQHLQALDLDAAYSLVVKAYLHEGKDGFECLKGAKILVDAETTPKLPLLIRNHFSLQELVNHKSLAHNPSTMVKMQTVMAESDEQLLEKYNLRREDGKYVSVCHRERRIVVSD